MSVVSSRGPQTDRVRCHRPSTALVSVFRALGLLGCVIALIGFAYVGNVVATPIVITDFTAPTSSPTGSSIDVYGGLWGWTPYSGANPDGTRILSVTGNSSVNYLAEEDISRRNIAGGTVLRLTADWVQADSNGHFKIDLSNDGGLVATAYYTYGQFASGLKTVDAPLTWNPSRINDEINQWYLMGNGNSNITLYGDLRLTGMAVDTASSGTTGLIWNTTDGTWNTTNTVWTTGTGGSLAFIDGDSVLFSGTGGGVVTLAGALQPSAITVSATSGTYTFVSSAGNLLTGTTGLAKSGGGTLILSGSNAFTGETAITGGVLLVNGVLAGGTTTVSVGLLGGSGTVSGTVLVAAGATIAPGEALGTAGTLSLKDLSGTGYALAMDVSGTGTGQQDRLVTDGNLSYAGNTLQLSMTGTYANGSSWDLFEFATRSGTLAGVAPLVATDPAYNGLAWGLAATSANHYDQQYGQGIWISGWGSNGQRFVFNQSNGVLTVVPEPSTFVMAAGAIAGFAILRWRRGRGRTSECSDNA